jgi:hypothetical protein
MVAFLMVLELGFEPTKKEVHYQRKADESMPVNRRFMRARAAE